RHIEEFSFNVPKCMVYPTKCTGQYGTSAVKRVSVDCLPVMHNVSWIFPNQVRLNFLDCRLNGKRPSLQQRFAEADDPNICMDFQEDPPGFNQKRLQFGDFHLAIAPYLFHGALRFVSILRINELRQCQDARSRHTQDRLNSLSS